MGQTYFEMPLNWNFCLEWNKVYTLEYGQLIVTVIQDHTTLIFTLNKFRLGLKACLMVSSKNSLNTPVSSIPASSSPCGTITLFLQLFVAMQCLVWQFCVLLLL